MVELDRTVEVEARSAFTIDDDHRRALRPTMRALIASGKGASLTLTSNQPVPTLTEPTDVLVRIGASALNPVDWKMLDYGILVARWPTVLGADMAGTVEAVGSEAAKIWKVGDKVWGCTDLGKPDSGTFAELCRVRCDLIGRVPDGMSMQDASTLSVGLLTAGLMLHVEAKPAVSGPQVGVLVYGASSSVGQYCVQLAAADGHTVVAVASKRNAPLLEKLGAKAVVDYHDADWEAQVANALGPASKAVALDTISKQQTADACARIVKACGGSIVALTGGAKPTVDGVAMKPVILGKCYGDKAIASAVAELYVTYSAALAKGVIKPNPCEVIGGLDAVSSGFDLMRADKVSGKKLVVVP
jgi:NADPH:quinone reductase-like Zn-dependent oxidoreductase